MTDIFDVLSDPTRRALLVQLAASPELPVGALVEQSGLTQPTVSKHLKVLRDAGLVQVREEAQHRFYRLDPARLGEVVEWLAPFVAPGPDADYLAEGTVDDESGTPFIAWSGSGVGEQLGRVAADATYQAREALERLQGATDRARTYLDDAKQGFQRILSRQ